MNPRILFMGTPHFAVPILEMLMIEEYSVVGVVTQPDRPKGRKRILSSPPVKEAAIQWKVPVLQPESLKKEQAMEQVLQLSPDLIITAAYGQILPELILQAPKLGCLNIHASLLPKYRGGAPIHWALINGEKKTGITIMYMVKELDAGDMLSQEEISISPKDHVGSLHDRLSSLGARMLKEMLPSFIRGETRAIPQNHQQATYAPNISRNDEWIDWTQSAIQIDNHVRGLHPWPVAITSWKGKQLKIWWVEPQQNPTMQAAGTILKVEKEGILVATGQGMVKINELQLSGKKRMSVQDFICGTEIREGEKLGD